MQITCNRHSKFYSYCRSDCTNFSFFPNSLTDWRNLPEGVATVPNLESFRLQMMKCLQPSSFFLPTVPVGSLSFHVVGKLRFMFDIKQSSLSTPFCSVLVSISVFMALLAVFHSTNSPDNSPFSHSALVVLTLPYWYFQVYISL